MAHPAPAPASDYKSPSRFSRFVDEFLDLIAYLYLIRVSLLIALVLLFLPSVALKWNKPLFQNLLMMSAGGTVWTTAIALALCWSLLLTYRLVLLNGKERFGLPQWLTVNKLSLSKLGKWSSLAPLLLAIPLIRGQFTQRADFNLLETGQIVDRLDAVAVGALIAYLLAFAGLLFTLWLNPPGLHPAEDTFPVPKFIMNPLKNWITKHAVKHREPSEAEPWWRRHHLRGLWAGYLDPATGLPWAGHYMAFTFALATVVLYLGLDVWHKMWQEQSSPIPALAYVLLLLLNLNWILAFFTFLLDRYRLPLIVPIALLCIFGARFTSSDHYYSSSTHVAGAPITPYDVLHARKDKKKPIILVATAGGGIQAGAWTARVLTGLQEQSRAWNSPNSFTDSVTLISSVSGGAMGSMYFLNLYGNGDQAPFNDAGIDEMRQKVVQSSLDDIAWATVYRDFWRVSLPYLERSSGAKLMDRGYMLERTWRNRGIGANLADWRAGVKEGTRPAAIFNSTIAESGEPLLLATTDLLSDNLFPKRQSFYEKYPNKDVPVVTAVRLAATFPYVTPASRIDSDHAEFHLVDGGYYDNPGVSSLVAWLDEGLQALNDNHEPLPDHVLIIQIRSFPDSSGMSPLDRGWFFQTHAPITGLLSVRTTAQLLRDREALRMIAQKWATTEKTEQGSLKDRIRFATFTFDGTDAPLSWAINEKQKRKIDDAWRDVVASNARNLRWVRCTLDPAAVDCHSSEKSGPY